MRIEYHRTLIADKVRNDAFYAALKAVIVPGKTIVADIGAGTGLLGLMAAKLGAKDVFMFETAEVAAVAARNIKANIKANGAKACHLIPCHSTEFDDALQADVIVSETLGNYALEENIIDTLTDARKRFLKPGGVIIPHAIAQWVAPVIAPRFDTELKAWDGVGHGLDLSVAKAMSFNNVYVRTIKPADVLGGTARAVRFDAIDLMRDQRSTRKGEATWALDAPATVFGFALWWSADLAPRITLSTAPDAPKTHWEQLYFPLAEPLRCARGESVAVQIRSRSSEKAGTHLAWTASRLDAKGAKRESHTHDLDKGYLP